MCAQLSDALWAASLRPHTLAGAQTLALINGQPHELVARKLSDKTPFLPCQLRHSALTSPKLGTFLAATRRAECRLSWRDRPGCTSPL